MPAYLSCLATQDCFLKFLQRHRFVPNIRRILYVARYLFCLGTSWPGLAPGLGCSSSIISFLQRHRPFLSLLSPCLYVPAYLYTVQPAIILSARLDGTDIYIYNLILFQSILFCSIVYRNTRDDYLLVSVDTGTYMRLDLLLGSAKGCLGSACTSLCGWEGLISLSLVIAI